MPAYERGSFGDFEPKTTQPEMDETARDIIRHAEEGSSVSELIQKYGREKVELALKNNIPIADILDPEHRGGPDAA